jgi:hypothetical protein
MPLMLGAILGMGFWKNKDNPIAGIGEGFQGLLGGLGGMFGGAGGEKAEPGAAAPGGNTGLADVYKHKGDIESARQAIGDAGGYDQFANREQGWKDWFSQSGWGRMHAQGAIDKIEQEFGPETARFLMTVPNDEYAKLMEKMAPQGG